MSQEVPKIGILVLNQNGQQWLPIIYQCIREQFYPHLKIYLVDNGSNDASIELTQKDYPEVIILRMPSNLGYCMAYNLAAPKAFEDGCEWVIWANNDVRLEAGCLEELARAASGDLRIGVLGPAFLSWDEDDANYYMVGNHPYAIEAMKTKSPKPIDVEWVEGSFLMVSRRCIESVGPLDPYLYFYWEEADFCRRARYQRWRVVLVPSALARHYAGGWSQADRANRHTANHLQSRNYYIYKLANPFQGFLRNCADAFHLFLVNIKEALWIQPDKALFHLRVFGGLMKDFRTVYAKWKRDRSGKHPNPLSKDLVAPVIDILPRRIQV